MTGRALNAYVAAGIRSDHEATTYDEALEKRRAGMWVLIREASNAHNLRDLLPLVKRYGPEHCAFCTDDREPDLLYREGHIDQMCRIAVHEGIRPEYALLMATLHPARAHGLLDRGAIAPGLRADLVLLDDLETFRPACVWKDGRLVAAGGAAEPFAAAAIPDRLRSTMRSGTLAADASRSRDRVRTRARDRDHPGPAHHARARGGAHRPRRPIVADPDNDVAKIAVVERHHETGRIGKGLVRGFGLRSGAFASTVAHDAHNLVDRRHHRRRHGRLRRAAAGDRRRDRRRARRRRARRAATAGRRPAVGSARRGRGRRAWRRCRTCSTTRASATARRS